MDVVCCRDTDWLPHSEYCWRCIKGNANHLCTKQFFINNCHCDEKGRLRAKKKQEELFKAGAAAGRTSRSRARASRTSDAPIRGKHPRGCNKPWNSSNASNNKTVLWTGGDLYEKSMLDWFLAHVRENEPQLIGPHSLGRGELGSRHDTIPEVCHNIWLYYDVIMDAIKEKLTVDNGILATSVYSRLASTPFHAEIFCGALMFELVINPMRALTLDRECGPLSKTELAPFLDVLLKILNGMKHNKYIRELQ